jgi:hypothetical protein
VTEKDVVKGVVEVFPEAVEVMPTEDYALLIDDLKDILTEHIVSVKETVIKMKWEIGERLLEAGEKVVRPLLKKIAEEVSVGERELYRCLAFREKFPTLKELWSRLPEGKNISWHKLVHNYIDFEVPKPQMPITDKLDEWGVTDWWQKQSMPLTAVRIRNKTDGFCLIVRPARLPKETSEPYNDMYLEISDYFIKLKKWDKHDLDRSDYARMHRAIKNMLEKANYNKEKVKEAIKWCHQKYLGSQIDWTLETVQKKYAEAVRPVHEYEKYIKRK